MAWDRKATLRTTPEASSDMEKDQHNGELMGKPIGRFKELTMDEPNDRMKQ